MEEKLMFNKELLIFIEQSKRIICTKFYQDTGISLQSVYSSFFDNVVVDDNIIDLKLNLSDYLGELYEKSISTKIRKDLGQFYTRNSTLIELMLSKVDLFKGKILEPSCGSGLFLVKIQEQIKSTMKANYTSAEILDYLVKNLHGNDVNETALKITELNLITNCYDLIVDAYKKNHNYKMARFNLYKKDFICKNQFSGYSLVIGNPPFVTMYGKRSRNMTEEKRKIFNTFDFVQNKNGNNKFNISMFFIENGLKSLKQNSELMYILDISFFETAYIDLRKYILENYSIKYICTGLSEFEGVASGQLVLLISNDNSKSDVEWFDKEESKTYFVNTNSWINDTPKYRFIKPLENYDAIINNKIRRFHSLDYYFPKKALRTCCALTGKTEEFIVESTSEFPIVYPYLEGSKGLDKKFGELTPLRYIKYDYDLQLKLSDEFKIELEALGVKNKKRVTLGNNEAYDSPKLFIRQSANELIATYTDKPFAANNSIYILTNKKYDENEIKLLKFTCGIMNSNLMTYYALVNKIIRKEKGKTPQIKTSDLKDIRIPFEYYTDDFIQIVDVLLKNPASCKMIEKLNSYVYEFFSITKEEIKHIEHELNK